MLKSRLSGVIVFLFLLFLSVFFCLIFGSLILPNIITIAPNPSQPITPQPTATATITTTPSPFPTSQPTYTPIPTATPLPPHITAEQVTSKEVKLIIPRIKVEAIVQLAIVVETELGPSFVPPEDNPMWIPNWSSEIGIDGLSVIYGHRQWGPKPKVFTALNKLQAGDTATLTSSTHSFIYLFQQSMVVEPDEVWNIVGEIDRYNKDQHISGLMLITCTPWGTDHQRLLVFFTLETVNATP